jgi:hypothetical protein
VVSKAYREGVLQDGQLQLSENKPEEQWRDVTVPTLLMRAGQGLFTDNDQLLSEENAEAIQNGIKSCRYVNFPNLNHYTIVLGSDDSPAKTIRDFVEKG